MAFSLRLCVLLVLVWAQEDALDGREPKVQVRRALLSRRSGRRLGWGSLGKLFSKFGKHVDDVPVTPHTPGYDSYGSYGSSGQVSLGVPKDVVINLPGHGLLVADLAPFLDDIPVKGARESFDSPDLIAVPVPGGVVTVPLRKPPKLPTPSNSVPALRPRPRLPGEQDVEDEYVAWKPQSPEPIWSMLACDRANAEGACLTFHGLGRCRAKLPPFSVVRVTDFYTPYEALVVNGVEYRRNILENQTFVLWSHVDLPIRHDEVHFQGRLQICMEAPPLCPDGFEVTPVAVQECPGAEVLSNCEEAEPGELCEGNGQCGTRTDINNCYDSGYTYPASRDVYRKQNFTRNESNATIATPPTTTTTTCSFTEISLAEEQVDGLWHFHGPCVVDDRCLSSPGYPFSYGENETCVASLPPFTALTVKEFNTEKFYDQLTVNGMRYSGRGLHGQSFVLWSNIIWTSDESNYWSDLHIGNSWKLCLDTPPVCSDGLVLTPVLVPDCPAVTERLRDCQRAEPGELCEGDGQCGTRTDINNCYASGRHGYTYPPRLRHFFDSDYTYPASRDVYQKQNGTAVSWIVDGPCSVVDGCVQNFDGNESRSQECNMSLTEAAYVTVRQFRTSGGRLEINGRSYEYLPRDDSIFVNSGIRWSSESGSGEYEERWLIRIGKHQQLRYVNPSAGDATEIENPSAGDATENPSAGLIWFCVGVTILCSCYACYRACRRLRKETEEESAVSPSPSRRLEDGVLPVLPSLPRQGEHSEPPLPETKQLNGISAVYALEIFPALARQSTGLENPNFHEMAPVVATGETGLGYGKTCPEDGEPNCSIVDAVEEHHKGKVSHFVSWCWACRLNDFVGALRAWTEGDRINAGEAYLWICFFCDNQYRLPKSGTLFSSAHELQRVLESRLARAGQMLFLVDAETTCAKRAWCLFEVFTCVDKQLPITIMLPATREGLQEAFSTIDLRTARATSKADEDMINEVVLTGAGFDAANARVRDCLLEDLKH